MRYLTLPELLELYRRIIVQTGGLSGLLDLGALESALAQPRITFGGEELYPTVIQKASALGFTLIRNHPFADGNKRIGHAAMEPFLILNGYEINANIDEQEQIILAVASGSVRREAFTEWLRHHVSEIA